VVEDQNTKFETLCDPSSHLDLGNWITLSGDKCASPIEGVCVCVCVRAHMHVCVF